MAPTTRLFNCKDVEVLTASSEIVSLAQANLAVITAKRPIWKDPFFPNLKIRIDNAFQTFLGVDNAADLRAKSATLFALMFPSKDLLSTFKINLESDFKSNKPRLVEIETTLGYTSLWKPVRNDDEEALIQLLYTFKTNITPALQTEIETAGMDPSLTSQIIANADTLKDANINQEFAKSQRPIISILECLTCSTPFGIIGIIAYVCADLKSLLISE